MKRTKTKNFDSVPEIVATLADQLRPPERMTVHQAAARYRYVNQPGSYVGWWNNNVAPYMVEVMNTLVSRDFNHLAFAGPAQSSKTDSIVINGLLYRVKVDPMDSILYCPTGSAARDFSIRRVDRLHRHSPAVGECLLPGSDSDNTFDKHYISGMMLTLSWPSVTELAGRPVGFVLMTDFDRMPDDVDGDGNPFDLASKRTTTFGSFAMCAAESSPSYPILDPKWMPDPKQPHAAPPSKGIMALYNRGDRRRWQWPCPHCDAYFEGTFDHLEWVSDDGMSNLEMAETVFMRCPHCGNRIDYDDRQEMQQWGLWVPEGMDVDMHGRLIGRRPRTNFASFWLRGVAAAFVSWTKLVVTYLDANDEYVRTGSEEALKKFWNNDMGEPYKPKDAEGTRLPENLKARAVDNPEQMVPKDVRFLVASVDVQKNMFRVQVMGVRPGYPFDAVLVDTFDIRKSKRTDNDGDTLWVKPAQFLEDWDLIEEQVMNKTYELADHSGRVMPIKHTVCDSGGKAGTTDNAYDFWRKMRDEGKTGRFMLVKGDHIKNAPRTRVSFPDSQRKDNKSAARGEIPVLMINSNMLKDKLNNMLDCTEKGKGVFEIPSWVPDSTYQELCAEVKDEKGGWFCPKGLRNEEWDLGYYNLAQCISSRIIGIEGLDWDNPPTWAAGWDNNSMVFDPNAQSNFAERTQSRYDFTQLGKLLAGSGA